MQAQHCLCCGCCIGLLTCLSHALPVTSFTVPSPLTVKLLQQLVVQCEKEGCSKAEHCSAHYMTSSFHLNLCWRCTGGLFQDVAKGDGVPDIAILPAIASQVCSQITEMW